jgi:hypothetical protein
MSAADRSRAMVLTGPGLLAAWNALELGESPVELRLRPAGHTVAERDRGFATALARLRERGLADARGPGARLAAALRLLADAPLALDLRLSNGLVALGAVAGENGAVAGENGAVAGENGAVAGEDGVVLVSRADGMLRLVEVRGPRVPAALVDLIGPLRAGRARTVNVDGELLDRARTRAGDGGPWTLADTLVELGTPRVDANSLARMCADVTSWGQIGALSRSAGTEHRGRWMVGFHRSSAGDFLQLRQPAATGREHVTVAPITAEGLLAQVRELVADLPAPVRS